MQGHLEFTSAYDSKKILYELFEAVVADTSVIFFFLTDFNSAYHLPKLHVDYLEKKKYERSNCIIGGQSFSEPDSKIAPMLWSYYKILLKSSLCFETSVVSFLSSPQTG